MCQLIKIVHKNNSIIRIHSPCLLNTEIIKKSTAGERTSRGRSERKRYSLLFAIRVKSIMQEPLIYDPNRPLGPASRVGHADSIHSVDSCLVDILTEREKQAFVPPS